MSIKQYLRQRTPAPLIKAKRAIHSRLNTRRLQKQEAVILQPRGQALKANHTFVIGCGPYFDQRVPNASLSIRMGFAHGSEELGIPYELVSLSNLSRLSDLPDPIVFMCESDYQFLSGTQIRELRKFKHFVWVNHWFGEAGKLYQEHDFDLLETSASVRTRICESRPAFVFGSGTESTMEFYRGWEQTGLSLFSLPHACDTSAYDRFVSDPKFSQVAVAFVGGYWPYKARNFDLYLKPHEKNLTVFGYSSWPYAGYGGKISAADEPLLYRDATISPAINEPHAAVLGGDICERVYKVLGSGGLCITDVTWSHRDLFTSDELLVPESLDEYHEIVRSVLKEPEAFDSYRENGYRAIQARHTYRHRIREILKWLGLADCYPEK